MIGSSAVTERPWRTERRNRQCSLSFRFMVGEVPGFETELNVGTCLPITENQALLYGASRRAISRRNWHRLIKIAHKCSTGRTEALPGVNRPWSAGGGFRKPNSCISELRPCGREQVRDKSVGYRSNSDGVADTLFWQPLMARQAPAAGHLRCQFASYQGRLCVLGRDRAGATAKEAQRAGIEHAWRTVRAIEAESQLSRGISSTWCAICGPAADIAPQLRTLPG
jgi:hypothetical protein